MIRALIGVANFAFVASLTKPIVPDYIELLKAERKEEDDFLWSASADSTDYDVEGKAYTLWPQDGSKSKCVEGPYVEDVSQAECQELAVENSHSFYQYREDTRRCATSAACDATIPGKMWNIFKATELGTHAEEMQESLDGDRTLGDEDLKAQALWPQDTEKARCVAGPYVEDVSQAECQELAVENRHSFYQYREDKRICATSATCDATVPAEMWNIFKASELGTHGEEMQQSLDGDRTLGDENLKAQVLWPQDTEKARCVAGPYVEDVSQAECQELAIEHRHSFYQYREEKRRCATSATCDAAVPAKMWNIFKIAEVGTNGDHMKQILNFERTEDNEELKTVTFPFDVFDMHNHTSPGREGDCKWRCDTHDRCARYEWDANMLVCKMFDKALTTPHPRTKAAPATASTPESVGCGSCNNTSAKTNSTFDSGSKTAPNKTSQTSPNTSSVAHTAADAVARNTSTATFRTAPNATPLTSSNITSKIASNVTSRTTSGAPPDTVPNATSYTASSATPNTTSNAMAYTVSKAMSSTAPNATSPRTTSNILPNATSRTASGGATGPTPNAKSHTISNIRSETTANVISYTTTNTTSNMSFLAMHHTAFNATSGASAYMDVNPSALPLSEEGYQAVAALKDDEAMLRYVRRELHTLGLRSLSESELRGWVPYFSGTKATRSREVMLEELRTKAWVDELPLSEQAYQKVAALKDDEAMLRYVRRELDNQELYSLSESELRGWVPYFSGTRATRSRKVMLDELRAKEWVGALPLSEERYQKVAALKDDEAMLRYVRRELHTLGLRALSEGELRGWVPYFSGTKATRNRDVMLAELRTQDWVGELPLSEDSYQKIAALKNDEAMMRYVRRELYAQGLRLLSEGELTGWVPYFSGTKAPPRSRKVMLDELRTKEWVVEPPLSEEGYQMVAALKDDEVMLRYVRRELDALGRRAKSEGALKGWVPYFSGTTATRSRAVMLDELRTLEWVTSNANTGSYAQQKKARQMAQ